MRLLLLLSALLVGTFSGCKFSHSGSQSIEVGPGYIRPYNAESNRAMWEATGDQYWRDGY